MGRLISIVLGGAALAFFVPLLLPQQLGSVTDLWRNTVLGPTWYDAVRDSGAGIFAGLALVLLAVRGRD